jgi:hypothetical protein
MTDRLADPSLTISAQKSSLLSAEFLAPQLGEHGVSVLLDGDIGIAAAFAAGSFVVSCVVVMSRIVLAGLAVDVTA